MTDTKECTRCGGEYPLDEFPRHSGRKDGRLEQCKECRNRRVREKRRRGQWVGAAR